MEEGEAPGGGGSVRAEGVEGSEGFGGGAPGDVESCVGGVEDFGEFEADAGAERKVSEGVGCVR